MDPEHGLAHLLRCALCGLMADPGLGAVLRSGQVACTETDEAVGELLTVFQALLTAAHRSGAIRADTSPDDLRRYLLGLETAVRLGGGVPEQIERDLAILVAGLRP